jgi:gamma-glutamylcyclotransferase (GGCT)/AIG2-like uncharacterized protein YtfP
MPLVVFNGAVMRDEPHHENLSGATFIEEVRTAPVYRLFSIGDRYPAMIHDAEAGESIWAELYEVPDEVWPRIRDAEPPGLYRGRVVLDDAREVEGMLGEQAIIESEEATDITRYGGWRAYRRMRDAKRS